MGGVMGRPADLLYSSPLSFFGRGANPLDLSSCNQTTKDILCPKVTQAFLDEHNTLLYDTLNKSCLGKQMASPGKRKPNGASQLLGNGAKIRP